MLQDFTVFLQSRVQGCRALRYTQSANMIRLLALTGCRRGEIIALRWEEVDQGNSCLRLEDTKEGQSVRPIGLAALEFLEERHEAAALSGPYVFPGRDLEQPTGSFPGHWDKLLAGTELEGVTAHILRHSFASLANDLGFTEITIAALLRHASGSITSRYVHSLDVALVMAADTVAGYIKALMDGEKLTHTSYALDRNSRKAALDTFLAQGQEGCKRGGPKKKMAA